jgi:SAM-dependent methyltransferase
VIDFLRNPGDYDFSRCKLCGEQAAEPSCRLGKATLQVCGRCAFHFIDHLDSLSQDAPQPELDEKSWRYIDERLSSLDHELAWRVRLVEKYCSLPDAQCLDIGAGVGQFLLLLRDAGGQGQGIEPSHLRRRFAQRKFDLHLEAQTLDSPTWRQTYTQSFDLITLWDVIEHVNFPAETIQNAFHLLKPGGTLFLDTPSREALAYRISSLACRLSGGRIPLFLPGYFSTAPYGHKQIFTPRQMRNLLQKKCGFEILAEGSGYDELLGMRPPLLRPRHKMILVARKSN